MADDRRIDVRFPSKMTVESPEIDSINVTAQRISRWLHEDFREIIKPLQVLPELPEILRDFKEALVTQFRTHFSGQVAVQMKSREANIRVAEKKAELVENYIDRKKSRMDDATGRVRNRYDNIGERLSEEHTSYLNQLDGHAYGITQRIYPEEIQAKFSFVSLPFWDDLVRHTAESAAARTEILQDAYEEARGAAERFLDARSEWYSELTPLTTPSAVSGPQEVPFWFATVEDIDTGERRTEVLFEWDVDELATAPDESLARLVREEAVATLADSEMNAMASADRARLEAALEEADDIPLDERQRFMKDCRDVLVP